jgi:hypothetical protein
MKGADHLNKKAESTEKPRNKDLLPTIDHKDEKDQQEVTK